MATSNKNQTRAKAAKAKPEKKRPPKKSAAKRTTASAKSTRTRRKSAVKKETVSYNPATLEEVARIQNTDMATMPELFEQAQKAQQIWQSFSFKQRKKHILKMRDYVIENADELAAIVSRENGKSRIDALATEVLPCALAANWYAKNAAKELKPKKLKNSSILFFNKRNVLARIPLGVVGIISPWNYPLSIPFGEVVMGLMAGNAIMLKVAAATISVGEAIKKIVEAGELPSGLFHHIVGSGGEVSGAFFKNGINKIFFTGSVPTGKVLMKAAADTLTPLSLELGGKDPMIVLADADLERAANGAAWAGYQNAGQSCGGVERVYVHESVYEKFVELLALKTNAMRHGVDRDFNVDMGAMTTQEQMKTVAAHVDEAVKKGALIIAQSMQEGRPRGYFYPATLMTGVDHSMTIMKEETFGPVIPVMKFSEIEEAIKLANDSTMALTSSVYTKNIELGKKIALRLESGVTTINDHLYTHGQSETPWGGFKESGLGRTHSELGLHEMTQPKVVNWDIISSKRNIWWFPFDKKTYDALKAALVFSFTKNPVELIKNGTRLTGYLVKKMFTPWKPKKPLN